MVTQSSKLRQRVLGQYRKLLKMFQVVQLGPGLDSKQPYNALKREHIARSRHRDSGTLKCSFAA